MKKNIILTLFFIFLHISVFTQSNQKLVQYFMSNNLLDTTYNQLVWNVAIPFLNETPYAYKLNISATKSMTGHCLGAAGVIEAIASIKALMHDIAPPTINHFTDDPELDPKLNFTFNKAQERPIRAALSNTFGFGGHNACVIVKKYQ